jgi:hypothetical protein
MVCSNDELALYASIVVDLSADSTSDSSPSDLSRARRSTGEVVFVKLVDLTSLKAPPNNTIPIHYTISLVEKLVALPQKRVWRDVRDSTSRIIAYSLASQFLEGARFLHEQKVAHLDLKPDKFVITATMRPQIIDFGVSVLVSDVGSSIVGYRGTEGWAAPGLKDDPDAKYQPIRADLWSVGRYCRSFLDVQAANLHLQSSCADF